MFVGAVCSSIVRLIVDVTPLMLCLTGFRFVPSGQATTASAVPGWPGERGSSAGKVTRRWKAAAAEGVLADF